MNRFNDPIEYILHEVWGEVLHRFGGSKVVAGAAVVGVPLFWYIVINSWIK